MKFQIAYDAQRYDELIRTPNFNEKNADILSFIFSFRHFELALHKTIREILFVLFATIFAGLTFICFPSLIYEHFIF